MSARSTVRFAFALLGTNLRATFALRGAFWLQAGFMLVNDFIFFTTWWIFFRRWNEIGGWRLREMAILYGVVAGAYGVTIVLWGGVRELSRVIAEGGLDPFLTQPKDPLLHVMGSRSSASGWGDVLAAVFLLGVAGCLAPAMLPVALFAVACSAVVVAATGVLIHSAAFWADDLDTLPRQVNEFVLIFSSYPQTVYGPWLRLVLFTAIPAGFIGYLPVEVLREFSCREAAYLGGGAALYATAAIFVFRAGLRRYASGNRTGLMA